VRPPARCLDGHLVPSAFICFMSPRPSCRRLSRSTMTRCRRRPPRARGGTSRSVATCDLQIHHRPPALHNNKNEEVQRTTVRSVQEERVRGRYLTATTILRLLREEVSPISGRRIHSRERIRIPYAATRGGCGLKELAVVGSMGKAVTLYKWRRKKEAVRDPRRKKEAAVVLSSSPIGSHWT
jgi:hypothetical protein